MGLQFQTRGLMNVLKEALKPRALSEGQAGENDPGPMSKTVRLDVCKRRLGP